MDSAVEKLQCKALDVSFAVLAIKPSAGENDVRPDVVFENAPLAGEFRGFLGGMVGGFHERQVASASPDDQPAD